MSAGAIVPLAVAGPGWQAGWMGLGLLALVLGGLNFIFIRSYPPSNRAPGETPIARPPKLPGISYGQILRDRRFWLIGTAYLLTGFSIIIPFTFLSTYAVQELTFSYDTATRLITIIGIGGTLGKLTLGPYSDKLGRIKIMLLSALLIAGGCVGIAYSHGWVLIGVTFVFGIGYGSCWSMYAACASDFFSSRAAGGIIGLWTFLLGIGSISGPIIAGWSADATQTLRWAFVTASLAGAGSLLLLLPLLKKQT
jgi:MFS family permease